MTGWSGGSNPSLATTGRVGVTAISPGPQPGDCRFKSGTRHLGLIVYWLGFGPFKAAKTGRNRLGLRLTVWGYGAVVPALPISRGLMAGQRTVNPSVEVRLLPREPWGLSSGGQSAGPSTRRPRVQIRSCGEKDITLDYESRDWGFKSLRERAGSASSMGEHLVHNQGTEVRFLR